MYEKLSDKERMQLAVTCIHIRDILKELDDYKATLNKTWGQLSDLLDADDPEDYRPPKVDGSAARAEEAYSEQM